MKISTEVKVGFISLLTLIVIIWGVNYLKGRNILNGSTTLYVQYENVEGLEASANILIDGYKIGTVSSVDFNPGKKIPFTVRLEVDKDYPITTGSKAELISASLLGTKAININLAGGEEYHESGDTLLSSVTADLLSSLMEKIDPITEGLVLTISSLDSTSRTLNLLLQDPSIRNTLKNLEGTSSSLEQTLSEKGDIGQAVKNFRLLSESLENQSLAIENSLMNIEAVSKDLKNASLDSLLFAITAASQNLSQITASINSGEGTAGKLIYDDSLYNQLTLLITDLDSLINDVNKNPKKYVHFSLF